MKARQARAVVRRATAGAVACLFGVVCWSSVADAAGLYFSDRGVRPLGRGGAFVAGADDLGAIWYNPAGLSEAGSSLLADFSWLHFTADVTRRTQITDSGGTYHQYSFDQASGAAGFLPIPTLGA